MRMQGIYPAMVTPFMEDGSSVQLDAIAPIIEWMIGIGVQGVFVCGTTGLGPLLTAEEKLEVTREALQVANGRIDVLLQAAGGDLPGTIRVANEALELGAKAVALVQPYYFTCDEEAQTAYINRVAQSVAGAPVYLYNIPGMCRNDLAEAVLRSVLDTNDNIVGIKESGSARNIDTWLSMQTERFQVVCGIDDQLHHAFQGGVEAAVTSFGNLVPDHYLTLYRAARDGDWDTVAREQDFIRQCMKAFDTGNLVANFMHGYRVRGITDSYTRLPVRMLNPEECTRSESHMRELGIVS